MTRVAVALLALLCAPLARAQAPLVVSTARLEFPSGAETISGVLAYPTEKGIKTPASRPAIVLVHEWWGLNEFMQTKAAHFAALGYVVLVPDLYRGQVATDPDTAHQLSRGMPHDRALRDLSAAIDALVKRPDVDQKRIGVVGWCMGGGLGAELATIESRLKAAVLYYGALPSDRLKVSRIKAAVLGNYGADDRGIPEKDARAFELQLKKQGNPIDLKIYPGAGHAFASSEKPEVFRKEAAADADARTDAFLARWLKP